MIYLMYFRNKYAFQDLKIIKLIEEITSMSKLEPDEKLYAGGLSLMSEGDFLNPHIDNSHDRDRKNMKIKFIVLCFYSWKISDGGNFELWDNKVEEVKTITSKFNRLVVMETNKTVNILLAKVKPTLLGAAYQIIIFQSFHQKI